MRAAMISGVVLTVACGGSGNDGVGSDGSSSGSPSTTSTDAPSSTGGELDSSATSPTSDPADTGTPGGPTYAEDVAPILATDCWSCHVEGGFAPFSLVDYDDVVTLGNAIVGETAARRMPPWPIDGTGTCQSFAGARWLSDDELATIAAWVEGGSAAGDLTTLPSPPAPPTLGAVSSTLALPSYTPSSEAEHPNDDYRCFVADPGLPDGGTITAFEVHPGVIEQAHHIVLFALDSDAAVQQAIAHEQEDATAGYRCFGGAGVDAARIVGAWTPGVPVVRYPEGTGVALSAGRPIVVQMHYNLAGGAALDDTTIDLQTDDGVTPLESLVFVDSDLSIPPGVADHGEESVTSFDGDGPVDLLAVFPHMHQIGRTMRVEINSGADTTCAADVPRYDFHWQELYSYAEGVRLQPGDQVRLQCGFDSTGRDVATTWGEGSGDEMCAVVFFARPAQ